jgi:FkbM family methyltransferase
MTQLDSRYIQYDFVFNETKLKMAGRAAVQSDRDIIAMVFSRQMFSTKNIAHHKGLERYYARLVGSGHMPILIDAGGNIGAASCYFNQVYGRLRTIAIEPDLENWTLLQHNLAGLNAEAFQAALSCRDELLYLNDVDFEPIGYRVGEVGNRPVSAFCIPTLLQNLNAEDRPFILKVDIEGGEDRLFSESTDWIDAFPLIIVELHDWVMPYANVSRNFYRSISNFEFDLVNSGENTFCFNRRLLADYQHG